MAMPSSDIRQSEDDNAHRVRRPKRRIASPELWEIKQLIASGVLDPSQYPSFDEDVAMSDPEETEDVDIELREDEPVFLQGQTAKTLELSPIKVVKAPDGSLNRAAMTGASLAKERKDMKHQKDSDAVDSMKKVGLSIDRDFLAL
jgi:ATP-dependent RNA helicase DHX8/PRP22